MSGMSKSARIQLWLDRLNRQAVSSQTVAAFCKGENISVPSFYQWKRRLSPRVAPPVKRQKDTPSASSHFKEWVLEPSSDSAKVTLPGGITISLGTESEMAALIVDRLLLHALPDGTQQGP